MLKSALLAAAAATAIAGRTIDLAQYYPSASAESAARAAATRAAKLAAAPSASLSSPARLYAWLTAIDRAERDLQRADVYVYLRSEENVDDTSDARPTSESRPRSTVAVADVATPCSMRRRARINVCAVLRRILARTKMPLRRC